MWYIIQWNISFSLKKKENSAVCYNMNKPEHTVLSEVKSVAKGEMLCDSTHMRYPGVRLTETLGRMEAPRG